MERLIQLTTKVAHSSNSSLSLFKNSETSPLINLLLPQRKNLKKQEKEDNMPSKLTITKRSKKLFSCNAKDLSA